MATTLRNSQLASKFYGANNPGQAMTMIPKLRFMFYAEFILNANAPIMDQAFLNNINSTSVGNISFKVKTIDKPKIDLTTVELNQYNRKRLVYTKTEYQPFTIKLHESVDGSIVQLWKDYFTYYFGDSRPKQPGDLSSIGPGATTAPTFDDSTGWGLRPISEDMNFFTRINLYSLFGGAPVGTQGGTGQYQMTSYLNPRITAIDFEQYDSSSSDTEEVGITFKYEAIEYNTITQGVLPQFGFSIDQVQEVTPVSNMSIAASNNNLANTQQLNSASFVSPASILPQTQPPAIQSQAQGIVNNAPPGYAVNQTGSTTIPGALTNTTNSTSSAVSSNLGSVNYGGPSIG